jgi:sugar (pentulose or hexulose) kinase
MTEHSTARQAPERLYIGIDVGTSGCRAIAIDAAGALHGETAVVFPDAADIARPTLWWTSVMQVLSRLLQTIDSTRVRALAVDGTSATLLLTDADCEPLGTALLYNDARSDAEAALIAAVAPPTSGAHGPTSSLAKLLYLGRDPDLQTRAAHALHQSDWLAARLSGRCGISDENNCLKLGYDVVSRTWPDWLGRLPLSRSLLPDVVSPGTPLGTLRADIAAELGLPADVSVVAGTTDGVAAFLATGAADVGDAVTSLGSTLVIKLIAEQPVFAPEYGVYSHRLGDRWLVGGASNCGGATLLKYFTREQLERLTTELRPETATGLHYYPLPAAGERFPLCDPDMQPRLTPRPADDVVFFQAILEGIADVEARAYRLLAELGAPAVQSLRTVGGGAANRAWTRIREQRLNVTCKPARHVQAAYGTALLAGGHIASRFDSTRDGDCKPH